MAGLATVGTAGAALAGLAAVGTAGAALAGLATVGTAGAALAGLATVGTAGAALATTALGDLAPPGLEGFWTGAGAAFADAFDPTAGAVFFDDSLAVLGAAAFEAFAFTTDPFFASAATMVLDTIGPSCRGEGDRR